MTKMFFIWISNKGKCRCWVCSLILGLMSLISNLGLLFDFGFDVVARFIFCFKKKIEEQVFMFLDL